MARVKTQQPLIFQNQQDFRAALEDTLKSGNADGLWAVLTSPEVCLFPQCATINAWSVLLTPHTRVCAWGKGKGGV